MIVLSGTAILLVERGRAPAIGLWSLPGGKIEDGETAPDAALREVAEETGLSAMIISRLTEHIFQISEAGRAQTIRIEVFYGTTDNKSDGSRPIPVPGDDASRAQWVEIADLENFDLTEGAHQLILAAAALFAENRQRTE